MRKLILGMFMVLALSACSNKDRIPEVAFKGTTVEDLVDKPNRELMRTAPPKQYLKSGMDNGEAGVVVSNNNLRAGTVERRLEDLQQYVCNLFKESVGEVCVKGK